MIGDVKVQDAPTIVADHEEAVEKAESDRWDGEQVHRRNGFPMVAKENEPTTCRLRVSLSPDSIALCVGKVTIAATFDATKPANPRFRVDILSAIQPATVFGALHGVYAGLVNGIRVAGHSNEHVISVGRAIPNATPYGTAMV